MAIARLFACALIAVLLLGSAGITVSCLIVHPLSLLSLALLSAAVGGFFAPRWTMAGVLFLLPLGGNRPGSVHAVTTTVLTGAVLLGCAVREAVIRRGQWSAVEREIPRSPLLFAGLLYTVVSCLSLSSLPLPSVRAEILNAFDSSSLFTLATSVVGLLHVSEHSPLYSLLSVYQTGTAFLFGVFLWQWCQRKSGTGNLALWAVFLGLLMSLAIGLLDYYGGIDLRWFRPLDPVVNPGNQQFRLQSFFAHSGWFAEYLTLTIPTCLVLLALRAPFWVRTTLIVTCLGLGEFVLILTYQRGGWLSYPITLIAVWLAIYVVRLVERGDVGVAAAIRRSVGHVLLSLPLTIVVSLALVFALQKGDSAESALSPYVNRFKEIQRTGDRTAFLYAGSLIGGKHPVFGGGADSFAWQFEREFVSPSGSYYQRYDLPLHGSAHNVYAQTFSGKGAVGLLALLLIPTLLVVSARYEVLLSASPVQEKLTAVIGGCFACAFFVYGNVQEIFYIQSLQLLFFGVTGVVAATSTLTLSNSRAFGFLQSPKLPGIVALLLCVHLVWEYGYPAPARTWVREYGCFPEERSPEGKAYRWCGERALTVVNHRGVSTLVLEAGPLPVEIAVEGLPNQLTVSLAPGEQRRVEFELQVGEDQRGAIRTRATSSFVPALLWPTSTDSRRLSFKFTLE